MFSHLVLCSQEEEGMAMVIWSLLAWGKYHPTLRATGRTSSRTYIGMHRSTRIYVFITFLADQAITFRNAADDPSQREKRFRGFEPLTTHSIQHAFLKQYTTLNAVQTNPQGSVKMWFHVYQHQVHNT